MKIQDMKQGKKIIISMIHNGLMVKAEATVLIHYEGGALITPVYSNGTIVNSCSSASLIYEDDYTDEKHLFKVDSLQRVDFGGSAFHIVKGKEITGENNRRRAKRYNVNIPGTAHVNGFTPYNIVVHDVSLRGMSFLTDGLAKYKVGDTVRLMFYKSKTSKRIDVVGSVARVFKISGHEAIGLSLSGFSTDYINFVLEKKSEIEDGVSAATTISA